MAGTSKYRYLYIMLCAVVVSIVLHGTILYHKNYYGQVSFLVSSSAVLSEERGVRNKLTATLDMSFREEDSIATKKRTDQESAEYDLDLPQALNNTAKITTYHNNDTYLRDKKLQSNSMAASSDEANISSGYILALKIYEQQTMATGNLMKLQCFASKLNLSVVQPLMKDSLLGTPVDSRRHTDMLQLDDVYNMEEWSKHTQSRGYAPLVGWEEFIEHAPRDVVLVQMKYPTLSHLKAIRSSGQSFPQPVSANKMYKQGCGYKTVDKAYEILKRQKFCLLHKMCYNFFSGEEIPLQVYESDLLGGRDPSSVTVVIDEWRGFGENQRVLIKENICTGSNAYREYVQSSARVVRDAERYAERYLTRGNDTGYLAVIGRYEMTALTRRIHSHDVSDPYPIIPFCLKETLKEILNMKKEMMNKETATFLSMDIGKYGSNSFVKHGYYGHQKDLEDFVSDVYGYDMNIRDWERTFESVVETTDTGYMAKVQQAIVARAKCVLFVGGGTFQRHTLNLYQQLHPDARHSCFRAIEKCTSPNRPIQ